MKKQKGITLIALAITIIILLILAGVVLNLTIGKRGIIEKAKESGENYKIGEILEKLELEKGNLYTNKNGKVPTIKEYIEHLISKNIITMADVNDKGDYRIIKIDGKNFKIEEESNKNIKITYIGIKTDFENPYAEFELTKNIAKITLIDKDSGINIYNCRYEFTSSDTELGLNLNKYTGIFEDNSKDVAIPWATETGKCYAHVLVTDNDMNSQEMVFGPFEISTTTDFELMSALRRFGMSWDDIDGITVEKTRYDYFQCDTTYCGLGSHAGSGQYSATFTIKGETIKAIMKQYNYTSLSFKYILGTDRQWVEGWGQVSYVGGKSPDKNTVKHTGGSHWNEEHYYEATLTNVDVENISEVSFGVVGYESAGAFKRKIIWN